MAKLSFLIPARQEEFLAKTVEDIIAHTGDETEVIVGLDGAWANPPVKDHPRVKIFYSTEVLGQRAMTNQLARLSSAKYVCKIDAHCALDDDFSNKMIALFEEQGEDMVAVPVMRNLHAFNWKCPNGHIRYQSPSGVCTECGKPTEKDVVWIAKTRPESTSYSFDSEPHFQYFKEYTKRPEYLQDVKEKWYNESMSLQGSFFMSTREKFWEWELSDEKLGNWGNQGIELACAAWLSGGRVLVNHKTWYAHMFRTQGGDFGFPWENKGSETERTKKNVWEKFLYKKHPTQIRDVKWLVEKFMPVPGWDEEKINKL